MHRREARVMSVSRAFKLGLERSAARDLGLMLRVGSVKVEQSLADDALGSLPDHALILLLDGPCGVPGAMILDQAINSALIDIQTMGHLSKRAAVPRNPTRTDAAMAEPLVDGTLRRMSELLDGARDWEQGFRFGALLPDGQALSLALGTGDYWIIRAVCQIEGGGDATILLALPISAETEGAADAEAAQDTPARPFCDRLLSAPARLDAVLCRLSLPLSDARALKVDEVLMLPNDALALASIEMAGQKVVSNAILGQMSGLRALRLAGAPRFPSDAEMADGKCDQVVEAPVDTINAFSPSLTPKGLVPEKSDLQKFQEDLAEVADQDIDETSVAIGS